MGTLVALFALVGCVASAPLPVPVVVALCAPAPAAPTAEAVGEWSGPEWGRVVLRRDGSGTYTDTYGTGPGRLEFHAAGDGYEGRWMESPRRFGTLRFALAPDGRVIYGEWRPDPKCTVGTSNGGALAWRRGSADAS